MPAQAKHNKARDARRTRNNSMYLVLKVADGELTELSSQVRPETSDQLFAITSKDSQLEHLAGPSGTRRNVSRTTKPCGECSDSKSKCTPISVDPPLCQRCKSKGRPRCSPHVPWSERKARREQHQSDGSPQSQTSMQFTSPLPEHHVLPLTTPPVPTSAPPTVYTDPYAVGSGEPLYSHLNNVTYVQPEYLDFTNAGDSLQMYTGGPHHSGVPPADEYSGMGTSWYPPNAYPIPPMAQAGMQAIDFQPAVHYQQQQNDGGYCGHW